MLWNLWTHWTYEHTLRMELIHIGDLLYTCSHKSFFIISILNFFLNFLFCIGVWPINNVVIVSTEQQRALSHTYTCIHSLPKPPPIQAATEHWAEFPVLYRRSLLVIHFKYSSMYMSVPNSTQYSVKSLKMSGYVDMYNWITLLLLLQSCLTLCDPIDGSPPCSAVPGILQARTLEWVAIGEGITLLYT